MDGPSIPEVLLGCFSQSYDHMRNIHAALRKMEGASIIDETMEHLSISVSKMEMETLSPSPYFAPYEEQMPDSTQEKVDDKLFASKQWDWGPPDSRCPPYYYLMIAFLYYQTEMKWLNRYLPKDQEDGKSPEKSEENIHQEENDEKELNGKQEGHESPEWSEEHICEHEETSGWDSNEESDKESEEHLERRRKRREELRRLNEERRRKIYEAEEARMVYEWNVYQSVALDKERNNIVY